MSNEQVQSQELPQPCPDGNKENGLHDLGKKVLPELLVPGDAISGSGEDTRPCYQTTHQVTVLTTQLDTHTYTALMQLSGLKKGIQNTVDPH